MIVDDEPIAREILETYCGYVPYLNLIALCSNAFEARQELEKENIDILFLDIKMPVLDGIALGKILQNPPQIIYTTAYKEYAADAFEISAADYLVKPFSMERFLVAVDKALARIKNGQQSGAEHTGKDYFFIKTFGTIYKVLFDDILYTEANGNYVKIVTSDSEISTIMTFTSLQQQLPAQVFSRVHRSFIVNKSKVTHLEGNRIFIGEKELPLGINYREGFFRELGLL